MSDPISYPGCGAQAQLIERFWLDATDGPTQHRKTGRPSKHWLTPPVETVNRDWPHTPQPELVRLASSPNPMLPAVKASSVGARCLRTMARSYADVPTLWDR